MRTEPPRGGLYFRALCGLLFLALSAWLGAALFGPAGAAPPAAEAAAEEELWLQGLALRRERPLEPGESVPFEGARLPAGEGEQTRLVFSGRDGLEALSPADAAGWDAPALRAVLEAGLPDRPAGGRAVYGFDWVYAALVPADAALSPGQLCRLRFEGFAYPLRARLLSLSAPEGGQRAAVFRLTAGDEKVLSLRFVRARIEKDKS